jgi:hypothetical protein
MEKKKPQINVKVVHKVMYEKNFQIVEFGYDELGC